MGAVSGSLGTTDADVWNQTRTLFKIRIYMNRVLHLENNSYSRCTGCFLSRTSNRKIFLRWRMRFWTIYAASHHSPFLVGAVQRAGGQRGACWRTSQHSKARSSEAAGGLCLTSCCQSVLSITNLSPSQRRQDRDEKYYT